MLMCGGRPVNLEVRHLRLVEAIAGEGSVTRAGKRLHLTQSALSHQLRDVEDRLGTPLFLRLNKKMLLTPAGEKVLALARRVLAELQRTEAEIGRVATHQEGVLRMATQCYTGYHWLPAVLKRFQQKHPQVGVSIVVEATGHPVEALLEGKLDLALVTDPPRDRRLTLRPLFRDELLVVMSPQHRLKDQPYVKLADLAEETLLTYANPEESVLFRRLLAPAGIRPRQIFQVKLTEAVVEMARAGLGVAAVSRWLLEPYLRSGGVRALRLTRNGFYRDWTAVRLRHATAPPYLIEFIDLVAEDRRPWCEREAALAARWRAGSGSRSRGTKASRRSRVRQRGRRLRRLIP
jgi:LysR family transcriptional regulator for metE and metH